LLKKYISSALAYLKINYNS